MMKGSSIKPLFDFVLIRPLEEQQKTPSGIVLPDSAKEKPQIGQIMAVGPGSCSCNDCDCDDNKCQPMVLKKGQKVLYKKWGGNEIKVQGEEWLLVEQKEVMAVIEK